jgi:hypothetical protein
MEFDEDSYHEEADCQSNSENHSNGLGSKVGWVISCLIIAVLAIASLLIGAGSMIDIIVKVISVAGGGSVLRGIILAPFFVIGSAQIIRGFFAVVEKDADRFERKYHNTNKGTNLFGLYFLITILGYIAVCLAVVFWAKQ